MGYETGYETEYETEYETDCKAGYEAGNKTGNKAGNKAKEMAGKTRASEQPNSRAGRARERLRSPPVALQAQDNLAFTPDCSGRWHSPSHALDAKTHVV